MQRHGIKALFLLLCVPLMITSGCGNAGYDITGVPCSADNAVDTNAVQIHDIYYRPSCFKVPLGGSMSFINLDSAMHSVTTDSNQPESFDSGLVAPGATFEHTFSAAGATRIHCKFVVQLRATVIVE